MKTRRRKPYRTTRPQAQRRTSLRSLGQGIIDWASDHKLMVFVGIAVIVSSLYFLQSRAPKESDQVTPPPSSSSTPPSGQTSTPGALTKGTPDYQTVLPRGKTIEQLGGWTRVSPPDHNPVYAYVDKVGLVTITVSQQPLPDGMQTDSEAEINQIAIGYNATQKIPAGDTTIHLGTSSKGPQSAIFVKKKTLVLIKAAAALTTDQWMMYVSSLQ